MFKVSFSFDRYYCISCKLYTAMRYCILQCLNRVHTFCQVPFMGHNESLSNVTTNEISLSGICGSCQF